MRFWERFTWLDSIVWDVRFAMRGFRKAPGYALAVSGTLALGLGVLAVAFSIFSSVVLRPYAVKDPYSLYSFVWDCQGPKGHTFHSPNTPQELADVRAKVAVISNATAFATRHAPVEGRPAQVSVVAGNYFSMLGGSACMGRPLVESDAAPGAPAVGVLSHRMWKDRTGSDPKVVGRTMRVNGQPFEVVGVACSNFSGLSSTPEDLWLSHGMARVVTGWQRVEMSESVLGSIIIRLKPGVTEEAAKSALLAYGMQSYPTWPDAPRPTRVGLSPRATQTPLTKDTVREFLPVFVAFGLILLIACANVANMALARVIQRQREIALRISLGAGRLRMVRQLLTESLLLALAGALAAWCVAYVLIKTAIWLLVTTIPQQSAPTLRDVNILPDLYVLWGLLAAGGATAILFGLIPAIQATRSNLTQANRGEFGAGYRPSRLRAGLVIAQASVCSLLLIAAVVSLRSERKVASVDPQFDAHGVYAAAVPASARQEAAARLAALPGALAGASMGIPTGIYSILQPEGSGSTIPYNRVSPEYFDLLRIPLLRGRGFTQQEAQVEAPVVIVSESAARRLWPGEEAVGKTLRLRTNSARAESGSTSAPASSAVIIGVVRDANYQPLAGSDYTRFVYGPTSAVKASWLLVRLPGEKAAGQRNVEQALAQAAPNQLQNITSIEDMVDMRIYPLRALFAFTGFMGALALLLTVSGVYGVVSYVTRQRSKEFGIRMALGAEAHQVAAIAFKQSLRLSAIGAVVGALLALALARSIGHNMQPIDVFDPLGYAGGMVLVVAAALAASCAPARRAAALEPWQTLRSD